MKYKGYTGIAEFDEDSGVIFGRVIDLRDVITFQADSAAELTKAFHDSVDDYLEFCASRGENPEKPFSGQFVVRIDPALHRNLATAAEIEGQSLNALVEVILRSSIAGRPGQSRRIAATKPEDRQTVRAKARGKVLVKPAESGGGTTIVRDKGVINKIRENRGSAPKARKKAHN